MSSSGSAGWVTAGGGVPFKIRALQLNTFLNTCEFQMRLVMLCFPVMSIVKVLSKNGSAFQGFLVSLRGQSYNQTAAHFAMRC